MKADPPSRPTADPHRSSPSEESFQSLVERLRGEYVIYRHLPDGTLTYVSPSVEDVLGFQPDEVRGMNWREYVRENNVGRQEAEQVEEDVQRGVQFHHLAVEVTGRDGTSKLLDVQERPVFDESGKYAFMEGIAKDITETTRIQRELQQLRDELEARVEERTRELELMNHQVRESESRYRDLVEQQGEFIVRWSPDGRRREVNDSYCRYLGRPRQELIGKKFFPVIVEEDVPRFRRAVASLTPDHPAVTYEHRVRRADGSIRWTQWTDTAIYDSHGRPLEYLSVGRDVTELKHAEDRLREREDHLAHVSRLATMGELVAGIAHEVHQPLHAASTFAEAARRHLESGQPSAVTSAIECTKEIADAISRTAEIIRRLRDFTKAHPVQMEQLNLNEVVGEAVEIMAFVMRRACVLPRLDLADDLPLIHGDRIQLQQVCVNLIQNACDAMSDVPDPNQQLLISTWLDHGNPAVSFRDAGVGIDPETADRLFEAFYSTKPDGMGMGLSLAKSIAEAHGAILSVKSNAPEPGATFTLTMPASQEDR